MGEARDAARRTPRTLNDLWRPSLGGLLAARTKRASPLTARRTPSGRGADMEGYFIRLIRLFSFNSIVFDLRIIAASSIDDITAHTITT